MLKDLLLGAADYISQYLNVFITWLRGLYISLGNVEITLPITLITVSIVLIFLPPTIFSRLVFIPYKLITIFLRNIGFIRDSRTWGVVYDSVTKDPVDPAYITVRGSLGQVYDTAITDLDGRFALILPPGIYTLGVEKANYIFPSEKLWNKKTDGYFTGLYFGDQFEVVGGERAISFAVPIDPVSKDWNQSEKKRRRVPTNILKEFRNASYFYFLMAGLFILPRYFLYKENESLKLLLLYIGVLIILAIHFIFKKTEYYHSVVIKKDTNDPLSFARIKVFRNKIQVASKSTSLNGQFTCVLPNGEYFITIEERNDKGEYNLIHTSKPFRVIDGSINRKFIV